MIIFGCPAKNHLILESYEGEMNHNHKIPVIIQEIIFRGQLL